MLTDYDRAWLDALKQSHKSWSPLVLAELRGSPAKVLQDVAGEVLVYHSSKIFVRAQQLVDAVVREIPHGKVIEQYEYECACAVHQFAATGGLSAIDARAFLIASGYHGCDLEAMREEAAAAMEHTLEAMNGFADE